MGERMLLVSGSMSPDVVITVYRLVDRPACKVPDQTDVLVQATLAFCHALSCLEGNNRYW